MDAYVKFVCTL